MSDDSRKALREKGLKIRREVLGSKYVDTALNNATDFNRPLQDLLNEFCWGGAWGREGLTRKERSMINLAMLTALGRTHEVETHVRGALNNGLTQQQIAEVLLQTAIYCGVPAAVDSFRAATKVIAEETAAGRQFASGTGPGSGAGSAAGKAAGTSGAPAGGIGPGPDTAPAR